MPYPANDDLPESVRNALPDDAQTRFRTVVNSALARGLADSKAFASGWSVVRNGWRPPKEGEDKWQRIAKRAAQTLFVRRPLENAQEVINWAKGQGFATTLAPEDMHVTQMYSKEPLEWPQPDEEPLTVAAGGERKVSPLGDQGAMVLHFASPDMQERYKDLVEAGAKSDFPTFKPHVTISWNAPDLDHKDVTPYDGPLKFGPERFKEVAPDWSPDKVTEKYNENHDAQGRFAEGSGGGGGGTPTEQEVATGMTAGGTPGENLAIIRERMANLTPQERGQLIKDLKAMPHADPVDPKSPSATKAVGAWARSKEVVGKMADSLKETAATYGAGTVRDAVIIAGVELAMRHFLPELHESIGFGGTVMAAAALTQPIGHLATVLGLSEHGIKQGVAKAVRGLIEMRKTQKLLGSVSAVSDLGAAYDVGEGRVLTKLEEVLLTKVLPGDAPDAIEMWLHKLLDAINAYQPKRDPAHHTGEVATHKYNEAHDAQGRFASGGGGGGNGGGGGEPGGAGTPEAPSGPLVFHGTSQAALDSVVANGIIPDKSKGASELHDKTFGTMIKLGDGSTNAYFAASPMQAARFAKMAAEATGSTPVVVPVHLTAAQANGLTWDNAGNQDTKLADTIPPSQIGHPAVGMGEISKLASSFGAKWKQFELPSYQSEGITFNKPVYQFPAQSAAAVRDLMGKAAGATPAGMQQVVFMVFLVDDKESEMEKAGARHSASDRKMLQEVHDHAVKLGAVCDPQYEQAHKRDDAHLYSGKLSAVAKVQVLKIDDDLGIVFGWAIVSKEAGEDYYDVQDDHIPEDAMLKASAEFMMDRRVAKEMHIGDAKGTIVFAWPLTSDIAKAMGIECSKTGLMIGMKPDSAELLNKFKSGEYSGFSIGGERLIDEIIDEIVDVAA